MGDDPKQAELPLEWFTDDELAQIVECWRRELGWNRDE